MGCDIHCFVERRRADGAWELLPHPLKRCGFCEGSGKAKKFICQMCQRDEPDHMPEGGQKCLFGPDKWTPVQAPCAYCVDGQRQRPIIDNRNYELFGALSGVRGEPIEDWTWHERGLPDDVSHEVLEESTNWGSDGHSHGYYTLGELDELDPEVVDTLHSELGAAIKWLAERAGDDPASIRIVFWYDS